VRSLCSLKLFTTLTEALFDLPTPYADRDFEHLYIPAIMLFLIAFLMLFSPLRTTLAQTAPQELFQIDAITLNLEPLAELPTNMRAFEDAAKAIYTEHFVENHFNTLDIPGPWMGEIYTVHDYLLNVVRFDTDADLASCAFSNSGVNLCDDSEANISSIRAILYSEVVRTRACAATIQKIYSQAVGLSETFRVALQHLDLMERLFYISFPPPDAESVAPGQDVTPPEIVAQYLQLRTRVLALGKEFQLLLLSSMEYLPTHYNVTDFRYLETLQKTLLEAGRNAETTSNMDCRVLFSGRHSAAMANYRTALCQAAHSQLPANDASPASVRAAAFQKVKWW
jgi:hypothetical protein